MFSPKSEISMFFPLCSTPWPPDHKVCWKLFWNNYQFNYKKWFPDQFKNVLWRIVASNWQPCASKCSNHRATGNWWCHWNVKVTRLRNSYQSCIPMSGSEITKNYLVSFRKPTPKSWVSETLSGFPNGSGESIVTFQQKCNDHDIACNQESLAKNIRKALPWFWQGVRSETLVKKLGVRQYFWVSRTLGNSVISLPACVEGSSLNISISIYCHLQFLISALRLAESFSNVLCA